MSESLLFVPGITAGIVPPERRCVADRAIGRTGNLWSHPYVVYWAEGLGVGIARVAGEIFHLPIEMKVDHSKRLVMVTAKGIVLLQDMLDYFEALASAGAMPYAKLFDARELDSRLSEDDLQALGARVQANAVYDPRGAIAAVATAPAARAAIERFRALGGARRPVEIFATMEGARAWLASR